MVLFSFKHSMPVRAQYFISIGLILLVSAICFLAKPFLGYKMVALLLLMVVSFIAMLFEIAPVLIAAVLSALIWNFFFIPPLFTFHINNAEDTAMFLLYFVVALVHAILTSRIRNAEKKARDKEEKGKAIGLYNTLLSSLSHELRTPIATILGSVDALKEPTKFTEESKGILLAEIDEAAMRLNRQVENLLNMTRLESGMLKPRPDWCDVNEVVFSVIHKLPSVNGHPIKFDPAAHLPLFKLDQGFLDQVLYNLLHNAVLYTPEHAEVTISVGSDEDGCVITVSDNGPGFPEQEIALVFDKFYRLPNSKAGGSGLGLSIVKGFIDSMNGRVLLRNNPEGGALFTITIPAETTFMSELKNE
jgi:two-component system sensor histidine kinase KdpD